MAKVSVIVPAAGSGSRFGDKQNKIFQRIKDQPLFIRTLEAFVSRQDVHETFLVVSEADMQPMRDRFGGHLGFMGVRLVPGGETRAHSVKNALEETAEDADLVCVHDAARPCVSPIWIDAVFEEAARTRAAILAYPVHGTLKKVSSARVIDETVPREELWQAQTPQVFARDLLIEAYGQPLEGVTDDAGLVEKLGHPVSVVPGDPRNIKITTPNDLALAAAVIHTLPKPEPKRGFNPLEDPKW